MQCFGIMPFHWGVTFLHPPHRTHTIVAIDAHLCFRAEGKRVSSTSGEQAIAVEFESNQYRCSEKEGIARIYAVLASAVDKPITVCYSTRDGTGASPAKAAKDYVHTEGVLTFDVGEKRKEIEIKILDDEEVEQDEVFEVGLAVGSDPQKADFDWARKCSIIIIDDDRPGVLNWEQSELVFNGGGAEVTLCVVRQDGNRGDVAFKVVTEGGSAVVGKDFMAIDEVRTMRNGASDMQVRIPITTKDADVSPKTFSVRLVAAEPGEGGHKEPPGVIGKEADAVVKLTGNAASSAGDNYGNSVAAIINAQLQDDEARTYKDQFMGVLAPDVDGPPSPLDWFLHILVIPWKLIFATIPPPAMGGGWPCFGMSLAYIGGVTLFIQEIATLFGCCIGMNKSCNAVIFVALGTSLPDTLASKSAAINDLTADASVGNVTGSNCVNVFLGLGLPWLCSSIYFKQKGVTQEWLDRYPEQALRYPEGGFIVPGDDLGFAVVTFVAAACVAFSILAWRRVFCGG